MTSSIYRFFDPPPRPVTSSGLPSQNHWPHHYRGRDVIYVRPLIITFYNLHSLLGVGDCGSHLSMTPNKSGSDFIQFSLREVHVAIYIFLKLRSFYYTKAGQHLVYCKIELAFFRGKNCFFFESTALLSSSLKLRIESK